jgi:hypothetical protein
LAGERIASQKSLVGLLAGTAGGVLGSERATYGEVVPFLGAAASVLEKKGAR